MMQILIVEDEHSLSDAIAQLLRDQHYEVDCVYDGRSGLEYARAGHYDLIILDVMLPQMDGFEVVKTMRREKISTPVLILTARENISDKITGLDCGADDYLAKPFNTEELLRRVGEVVLNKITYGDLTLDLERAELRCGEKAVHLGYKEFAIMQRFMQHPQISISKEELIVSVWGSDSDAGENNVEVYISFLRKKLAFLGSRVQIYTLRRIGYRLEDRQP